MHYYGKVVGGVLGIKYKEVYRVTNQNNDDWMQFILAKSDGITPTGQFLLQKAAESYVYAVSGAQACTCWQIVGMGAKSLQSQQIFCTNCKR